jgi:hypothetical protein
MHNVLVAIALSLPRRAEYPRLYFLNGLAVAGEFFDVISNQINFWYEQFKNDLQQDFRRDPIRARVLAAGDDFNTRFLPVTDPFPREPSFYFAATREHKLRPADLNS